MTENSFSACANTFKQFLVKCCTKSARFNTSIFKWMHNHLQRDLKPVCIIYSLDEILPDPLVCSKDFSQNLIVIFCIKVQNKIIIFSTLKHVNWYLIGRFLPIKWNIFLQLLYCNPTQLVFQMQTYVLCRFIEKSYIQFKRNWQ